MIITVAAGKTREVRIVGRFFRCREASAAFDLKIDSDTYTCEGGDELAVRDSDADFTKLLFTNLSATETLTVDFFAGKNLIRSAYVKLPRTRMEPADVNLAINASQNFPGIDANGRRRKQFTITVQGIDGRLEVRRLSDNRLIAVVRVATTTGSGFAIETDDDLKVVNKTGGAITDPNIAIAETFYR